MKRSVLPGITGEEDAMENHLRFLIDRGIEDIFVQAERLTTKEGLYSDQPNEKNILLAIQDRITEMVEFYNQSPLERLKNLDKESDKKE